MHAGPHAQVAALQGELRVRKAQLMQQVGASALVFEAQACSKSQCVCLIGGSSP